MKPWALVVRLGAIGDNIIASSVLPLLARDFNVEVMAQAPHHVLFENNPYVSKLTVKEAGDIPHETGLQWQQWFAARGKEYAKWVNLSHSCETIGALFPSQTSFYWPASWRRAYCGRSYLEMTHDVAEVPHIFDPGPRVYVTEEERCKAAETLAKVRGAFGRRFVVGVPVSGSRLDKSWPHLPALVSKLLRETNCSVVLFGTPQGEKLIIEQISDFVRLYNGTADGLHIAATVYAPDGKTILHDWPIRRAIATLQQCDVVVGPDTGLMWSVAMEDVPKIMLLSHASPTNITAHWRATTTLHTTTERVSCWPCHQLHDEIATCRKAENAAAAACIADISDEAVFAAVSNALKGTTDGRHLRIQRENPLGLEPHHEQPDEAGGMERRPVPRGAVVDLRERAGDRIGCDEAEPLDGERLVSGG